MAMLKPKLKMKKQSKLTKTSPSAQHEAVMQQRKSPLQMDRQIAERAKRGMR